MAKDHLEHVERHAEKGPLAVHLLQEGQLPGGFLGAERVPDAEPDGQVEAGEGRAGEDVGAARSTLATPPPTPPLPPL